MAGTLRSTGIRHDQAIGSLYTLLLRGARAQVARHRSGVGYVRGDEIDDIATQAADDALVAVLAKLDEFAARAASRRGRTSS